MAIAAENNRAIPNEKTSILDGAVAVTSVQWRGNRGQRGAFATSLQGEVIAVV